MEAITNFLNDHWILSTILITYGFIFIFDRITDRFIDRKHGYGKYGQKGTTTQK